MDDTEINTTDTNETETEGKEIEEKEEYEVLEVDKVTEGYKEKMAAFFKVRKHVIMTAVLTSVALIVAIVAIAVGVNINKTPKKHQPEIVEAAETETETWPETKTQEETTEETETEEESTEEETYQVIENIMTKIVKDSTVTQKEDPIKNRNNESSGEVIKPVSYVDNAVSGSVSVSSVKKSGDDIVYTVKSRKAKDFTEKQIAGCVKGSVLVQENEQENKYAGYIYETGMVEVTGGSEKVVTTFLMENNSKNDETKETSENIRTLSNIEETSQSESESSTESKKVSYIVMEVEAQIEYIYADGWQNIKGKNYYFEDSNAVTGWKNIDGVQYYFNADGSLGSSLVIDVSRYNGSIDWNSVKASGINYAMIRVGYRGYETANLVLDNRFHENMSQAIAAGVKVGAYIVTQAVNTTEAVEEASFIVSACSGYNISLPLAIDVESAGNGSGRGDKISSSQRTAVVNAFAQTVNNCGYSAVVYANKDWMNNRMYAGNISCSVWLAQYRSQCTYTGPFSMWQFTDKARVNGISGYVDMSVWKH